MVLFDEVTSALDPELVGEVLQVIRKLGTEHDLTMLMVTHQMGIARNLPIASAFSPAARTANRRWSEFLLNVKMSVHRQFLHAVLEAG